MAARSVRANREIDVRYAFKRVKGKKQPDRSWVWIPRLKVCGQVYRVVVDPDLELEGSCEYITGEIRLREMPATRRMLDTLVHEIIHAILDACGMGWQIRQRLKMTQAQWRAFEEDFIVRPMTPALLVTLEEAGWLALPKLPTRRAGKRHR
jgi:hypothetical protein